MDVNIDAGARWGNERAVIFRRITVKDGFQPVKGMYK
jgi:hypothetical protein